MKARRRAFLSHRPVGELPRLQLARFGERHVDDDGLSGLLTHPPMIAHPASQRKDPSCPHLPTDLRCRRSTSA